MKELQLRVLEILSRGCLTTGAAVQLLGITDSRAGYALRSLWREGLAWRYRVGRIDVWCRGPPGAVGVLCGGRVVYVSIRRLARAAIALVQQGVRALRPAELFGLHCSTHYGLVRRLLASMLDGCAVEDRRSGRHVLLITDLRCVLERLGRLAEDGRLQLSPLPPPPLPPPRPRWPTCRGITSRLSTSWSGAESSPTGARQ